MQLKVWTSKFFLFLLLCDVVIIAIIWWQFHIIIIMQWKFYIYFRALFFVGALICSCTHQIDTINSCIINNDFTIISRWIGGTSKCPSFSRRGSAPHYRCWISTFLSGNEFQILKLNYIFTFPFRPLNGIFAQC